MRSTRLNYENVFDKNLKNITTEEEVDLFSKKIENYLELTGKIEINGNYYNNCDNYKSTFMNKLDKKLIKIHEKTSKMALTVVYGGRLSRLFNKIKALFQVKCLKTLNALKSVFYILKCKIHNNINIKVFYIFMLKIF